MRVSFFLSLAFLFLTTGCATVIEGRTQQVEVNTNPQGAKCILKSNDEVVGIVNSTPETLTVNKSKYDIVMECEKKGFVTSKIKNHADVSAASLGNYAMLTYSFIGNFVDSATGAANKYDSRMMVELDVDKQAPTQLASAAPVPQPQAKTAPMQLAQNTAAQPLGEESVMAVPYEDVSASPIGMASNTPAPTPLPAKAAPIQTAEIIQKTEIVKTAMIIRPPVKPGATVMRLASSPEEVKYAELTTKSCGKNRVGYY